jgi:hypothetical protein
MKVKKKDRSAHTVRVGMTTHTRRTGRLHSMAVRRSARCLVMEPAWLGPGQMWHRAGCGACRRRSGRQKRAGSGRWSRRGGTRKAEPGPSLHTRKGPRRLRSVPLCLGDSRRDYPRVPLTCRLCQWELAQRMQACPQSRSR